MPTEIIMPALGMSQDTGLIIAWLKNEGDAVRKGDILMEIETDKATVEIEALADGTLAHVTAQAGEEVPVGAVIALILADGEQAPSPTRDKSPSQQATPVALRVADAHGIDINQVTTPNKKITRADVEAYVNGNQTSGQARILASPKARRLAREQSFDLSLMKGSGPDGAVLSDDVLAYQPTPAITQTAIMPASTSTEIQTGTMWRRMAQRLTESWQTIPHFYLKRHINVTALMDWRNSLQARYDNKVTYTDLLIKVVATALRKHPHVNGQWNGEGVIFNQHINIGLAVAVDEGLLVPIIHDADTIGITAIAEQRKDIVARTQQGKLRLTDLQDGTFTISNLGMFGIDEFSAIVNPPQAAILAVGRITDRVVPVDGQAIICPMMTLNLSCDHRAVDGARAAQFMQTLAQYITDPLGIMD